MEQTWRWFGSQDGVTLAEARQAGATGIVTALHDIPYGAVWSVEAIEARKAEIAGDAGLRLRWSVAESLPVHEAIKIGEGDLEPLFENYRVSLRNLAACGVRTICYNFMPVLDWARTEIRFRLPHGGLALRFNAHEFAAFAFGAFSVVVGTGQMLVIASGPGNIDLSVPSVLTLAAYVSMAVMHGSDGLILPGLATALVIGAAAGLLNYLAITALRLPPIIATLAWSFVFQSLAFNFGGEATLKPPAALSAFTALRLGGVQVMPLAVMVLTAAAMVMLRRTPYGRRLLATGQSERAADLAGIRVGRVRLLAYMVCGAAAALTGFLLSGFTGAVALNMGDTYLMESIAVVVPGGTSVAGGQAKAVGIWGAALFFNLMATMSAILSSG